MIPKPARSPVFFPEPGDALVSNLEAQAQGYRDYIVLLAQQRRALMRGDLEGLSTVNAAIDAAVSELLRLEVDREALVRSVLEAAGQPTAADAGWFTRSAQPEPAVKCEALVPYLSPETGRELLSAREALRGVLADIERAASVNAALAQNGQRMIATTLASLTSLAGPSSGDRLQTYNTRGESQHASGRRQIRNLVNRSA